MDQTKELVFEIGTEELPSTALTRSCACMKELVEEGLAAAHLAYGEVECVGTPRRIATMVHGLAPATEALEQHFRGPAAAMAFDADGNPTKAAQGFARGKGVDASQLVVREQDGKDYVWVDVSTPARPAAQVVRDVLAAAAGKINDRLTGLRTQRWGTGQSRFSRPVRWLVCLLDDEVVPVEFCGLTAGRTTRGHRLMDPGDCEVPSAQGYVEALEGVHVVVSGERRAQIIREGIARIAAERGLAADTPKKTFDEVVNLVEWPTVLVADFDRAFLDVPHEIICESMLSNQRYFPLYDADGNLTNHFVLVSNGDPARSEVIAAGNERVVRARLSDAKFFYEEDLRRPLEEYVPRLAEVGFQEKLGTMLDKTGRIEALAGALCRGAAFDGEVESHARRAAHLAKADLVTGAVVEFTSQQGVMGGYYAEAAGEPADVCAAIREHYRPRFAGDELPSGTCGKCVAIADKLDTACGIFAIHEPPTGSSDPYAVRRAAIGIIAMLRTMPSVHLKDLIALALSSYAEQGLEFDAAAVQADVEKFFLGRLAAIAKEEGVAPDAIEAVSSVGVIDPAEFLARAEALDAARSEQPELFDDLATAYARAHNLADASLGCEVDAALLGESERALLSACEQGEQKVVACVEASDFAGACSALAELREPIDRFFEDVLVMDEDTRVRENRLRLLNRFASVFADVANIGALSRKK